MSIHSIPPISHTPQMVSLRHLRQSRQPLLYLVLIGWMLAFVPRQASKITVGEADGTEVSLEGLTKSISTPSTPALSSLQSLVLRWKAIQVVHDERV